MATEYIDIHSHLTMYDKAEREKIIARMHESNTATITVGTNTEDSQASLAIARDTNGVMACVGIHPIDGAEDSFDTMAFEQMATDQNVVAIGECGLDYFKRDDQILPPKKQQVALFEAQIELAAEYELPLMLHVRPSGRETMDAYEDALEILEYHALYYGERLRGNAHFFAGDTAIAKRFLDLGFTVSFTGVITFAPAFNEVVRYVPVDMLHAETDAPFVAPEPHRGEQNEPSYVRYVYEYIAKVKQIDSLKMRQQLIDNSRRYFIL